MVNGLYFLLTFVGQFARWHNAKTMLTFDSFTLIPAYSEIESRSTGVDISSLIMDQNGKVLINLKVPVINANMHSICTQELIDRIIVNGGAGSYHRFFRSQEERNQTLNVLLSNFRNEDERFRFFPSIGVQKEDYDFVDWLAEHGAKNVIVDVNHGHHKLVGNILKYIRETHSKLVIMAGNVSSTDGIKYLRDNGAHIIKIGNSFGFSCTTIKATGFGVHPVHTAKTYRDDTDDWDTQLCIDGGIRMVSDISKSLIWANIVMIGKMFAGCDESAGQIVDVNGSKHKLYYGNASVITKSIKESLKDDNHIRHVEGAVTEVPCTGSVYQTLNSIVDGIQGAFSFVGARNLTEYQIAAQKQILMVK